MDSLSYLSGGGGNRTRVLGFQSISLYMRSLTFKSCSNSSVRQDSLEPAFLDLTINVKASVYSQPARDPLFNLQARLIRGPCLIKQGLRRWRLLLPRQ